MPRLRRALTSHNFEHVVYGYEAEPAYLQFSALAYAFGVLHQRLVPRLFRPVLHVFARIRKADAAGGAR